MTEPSPNVGAPDDFNLDDWIDGTCGMRRTATIYQRGDLLAVLDGIEHEIKVAKAVRKEDRGLDDPSPEDLERKYFEVAEELSRSALTVHIQDSTNERRRALGRKLKADGLDPDKDGLSPDDKADINDTIGLHMLAAAIIKLETASGKTMDFPDGFPFEKLRAMQERLGDTALSEAWNAYMKVTTEAPNVAAPLSRRSSSNRGGIT